jgi:hypothetical protein
MMSRWAKDILSCTECKSLHQRWLERFTEKQNRDFMKALQGVERHQWFAHAKNENKGKNVNQKRTFDTVCNGNSEQKKVYTGKQKIRDEVPFTEWYKDMCIMNPGLTPSDADAMWKKAQQEQPQEFLVIDKIIHRNIYRGRRCVEGEEDSVISETKRRKLCSNSADLEACIADNEKAIQKWQADNTVIQADDGQHRPKHNDISLINKDTPQLAKSVVGQECRKQLKSDETDNHMEAVERAKQMATSEAFLEKKKEDERFKKIAESSLIDCMQNLAFTASGVKAKINSVVESQTTKNTSLCVSCVTAFPNGTVPQELQAYMDTMTTSKDATDALVVEIIKTIDADIQESKGNSQDRIIALTEKIRLKDKHLVKTPEGTDKTPFNQMKKSYSLFYKALTKLTTVSNADKEGIKEAAMLRNLPEHEKEMFKRLKAGTIPNNIAQKVSIILQVLANKGFIILPIADNQYLDKSMKHPKMKKHLTWVKGQMKAEGRKSMDSMMEDIGYIKSSINTELY